MKRFVLVVSVLLLAVVILSIGCAPKAPPPPTAPTRTVTGNITEVAPSPGGGGTITVATPQGTQVVPITSSTELTLGGQACTLDQLDALELAKVSYNCTLVYGVDEGGNEVLVGVDVSKTFP